MTDPSQSSLTFNLWFEDADGRIELAKSEIAKTEDDGYTKHSITKTDRYSDAQPIPWTAGVMAHMWYFVKCAIADKQKTPRKWELASTGTPMKSIHDAAPKDLEWRGRLLGDVWIQELILLKHVGGSPHRCLNQELVPAGKINVFMNDTPVVDLDDLNVIKIDILNQFNRTRQKRASASNRTGVYNVAAHRSRQGKGVERAEQFDGTLAGLQSCAQFSDQLWVFPADRRMPSPDHSFVRGLGEPQAGVTHSFEIGSRIRIGIHLEHEGYLTLLDQGPEQKLFCLCPSHFARDTWLPKGTSTLPRSHSVYDAFELSGIPGRELLLAVVTDAPMTLDWMPADSASPARVLEQKDVDELLSSLELRPRESWAAFAADFHVISTVT